MIAFSEVQARNVFSIPNYGVGDSALYVRELLAELQERWDATLSLGSTRQEAYKQLYQVFEECRDSGWDGYGAEPISFETYEKAKQFVAALPRSISAPQISVEPDGEISFEWYSNPSRVFSVSVSPKNELNYAGLFGASRAYGTEVFYDEIPEVVLVNIRRVI